MFSSYRLLSLRRVLLFAVFAIISLVLISCVLSPTKETVAHNRSSQPNLDIERSPSSYLPDSMLNENREQPFLSTSVDGTNLRTGSISELIEILKKNGMWNLGPRTEISPLLVNSFPADLSQLDVDSKKRVFFNTLLPVVIAAQNEIRVERQHLLDILAEHGGQPNSIIFSDENGAWKEKLSDEDVLFVKTLSKKYRHDNGGELLKRINVLPVSLVLAQGAIESSWGTSRFANMGNNLFGMWTWGEQGIVPLERSEGKSHKLAAYDSILESVKAYLLTINRISAYERLRDLRGQTMDPIELSKGLIYYSERRQDYVEDLQSIISYNKLAVYDRYRLSLSSSVSI